MCQPKNFQLCHELGLKWCQAVKSNRPCAGEIFIGTNCSESLAASQEASRSSSSLAETSHQSRCFVLGKAKFAPWRAEGGKTGIGLSTVSQVITVHCTGHLNPFWHKKLQENVPVVSADIKAVALRWELLSAFLITMQKVSYWKKRQLFCAMNIWIARPWVIWQIWLNFSHKVYSNMSFKNSWSMIAHIVFFLCLNIIIGNAANF